MKTNKLLTTLAIVSIALVAFFTGCNKTVMNPDQGTSTSTSTKTQKVYSSPVPLGTASTFAVLAGTTVTNATTSLITGDAGVGTAGNALTGFNLLENTISPTSTGAVTDGLGIVEGIIYAGGPVAAQAHADAQTAYTYLMAQKAKPANQFPAIVNQLDGLTLKPGVYNFPISANLAVGGTLTLDFQGNSNALFIFQTVSTLVTMANSNIIAINAGNSTCLGSNVFWAVGSSATIDGASFIGTVIAYTTITMTSAENVTVPPALQPVVNVSGIMLALGGEVTMVNSIISVCGTVSGKVHPKPAGDWVTGGGWITDLLVSDKATFGVSGGIKNDKLWGQLLYNDHNGTQVKSIEVTNYTVIDSLTRQIDGLAKVNGEGSYPYTVVVSDLGEPGRNDTFSIALSTPTVYFASGTLNGGNIQLHVK